MAPWIDGRELEWDPGEYLLFYMGPYTVSVQFSCEDRFGLFGKGVETSQCVTTEESRLRGSVSPHRVVETPRCNASARSFLTAESDFFLIQNLENAITFTGIIILKIDCGLLYGGMVAQW